MSHMVLLDHRSFLWTLSHLLVRPILWSFSKKDTFHQILLWIQLFLLSIMVPLPNLPEASPIKAGVVADPLQGNQCFAHIAIGQTTPLRHAISSMDSHLRYRNRTWTNNLQNTPPVPVTALSTNAYQVSVIPPQPEQHLSLTREDYQHLLSLLHASKKDPGANINSVSKQSNHESSHTVVSGVTKSGKSKHSSHLWIPNSGVSEHICPFLECFTSYKVIPTVIVKLPNGHILFARKAGTIHFSSTFILDLFCIIHYQHV